MGALLPHVQGGVVRGNEFCPVAAPYVGPFPLGYSLPNTLKFQRLKFGRQKLAKGPDMIRQACGHRWGALLPSRTNRTVADTLVQGQLPSQAHMRSADIRHYRK
jgi:hypothetical protein